MKKWLLIIACAPSLLMAQTGSLTLSETREAVLKGNPSVRESLQRIAAAEAVLKQAKSAYLPTLSATANYGHVDVSLHPDTDVTHRYNDGYKEASAGLQASWLLFDGFARRARALSAKYSVQQNRELADETRRLLIQSATVAFRQAQLAKENMEIAEQDRRFNLELEDDARKRYDAGTLPEADVHTFSIRALLAETTALESQQEYRAACTVLAQLMALPDAQLPEDMQPMLIAFQSIDVLPDFSEAFLFALAHRPDYLAVYSGHQILAEQVKVARGDLLPKVVAVTEINYADREGYSTSTQHGNYDSYAGVTLQWDLFTGGRKINTVKQARAEMRALEEQQESLRLAIRSALQQQLDAAETAQAVFERQEKIHALSMQVRDSVRKSYKAGVTSITRLNEAQTELVRAQGAHAAAYIAYQLSLNQLDIQTGRVLSK